MNIRTAALRAQNKIFRILPFTISPVIKPTLKLTTAYTRKIKDYHTLQIIKEMGKIRQTPNRTIFPEKRIYDISICKKFKPKTKTSQIKFRVMFLNAFRTHTMAECHIGVFVNIFFHLIPGTLIVTDFLAE